MNKLIFLVINIMLVNLAVAQQSTFSRVLYDSAHYGIQANSVVATPDHGYIIAGGKSYLNTGGLLIKLDSSGHVLWNKTVNGTIANLNPVFNSIIVTADSCYMLAGSVFNPLTNKKAALCVKINPAVDTIWSKIIGNPGYDIEALAVQQTNDAGFVIIGYAIETEYENIFAARLDASGNLVWSSVLKADNSNTIGYSVKQTIDNGFILISYGIYSDEYFALLTRLDQSGNVLWSKQYEMTNSGINIHGNDVLVREYGFLCYLSTESDVILIKTDSNGNIIFTNSTDGWCSGGNFEFNSPSPKLHSTSDGGYVFVNDGIGGSSIIKSDSSCNFSRIETLFLNTSDVAETFNKEFLIIGNGPLIFEKGPVNVGPQTGLIQIDSLGNGTGCVQQENLYAVTDTIISHDLDLISTNIASANNINLIIDTLFIVEVEGCVDAGGFIPELNQLTGISIFPNPACNYVTVISEQNYQNAMITVYNTQMQEMLQQPLHGKSAEMDISAFSPGMYFVKVQAGKASGMWKLMKD
ncbi:MAG: T9SS type A sorting domain-containing protein [Bacteroidia bacterium]|nr:T9SS type A sorting domain-containing protein [Bacteroidia bacterium]